MKFFGCVQKYYSPEGVGSGAPEGGTPVESTQSTGVGNTVDYERIQQMLDGTLKAKEDTALKAYFKQQGLSQEEAQKAIDDFKTQKAANQPDVQALTSQNEQYKKSILKEQIKNAAMLQAMELGMDAKTIPYLLRMADFSKAADDKGTINAEAIKTEINAVLEAVPALKPSSVQNNGFVQVGNPGRNSGSAQNAAEDALKAAFGVK